MRFLPFLFLFAFAGTTSNWETDFTKAQQKAQQEHKFILLNFSGSDWCIPCIKLHKELFESPVFTAFSDSSLVLVNADFPRLKKNSLSKEQEKKNEVLADKYDKEGHFPYTVLLDEKGNVVKKWDGYPNLSPQQFILQVKENIDARK
ncbi:MAG: thioredoxin family protein [Chitinophagaceae bacterium]|nr:MAG: thioredoxin family protein [Chitinophagaceae bacterium]